MNEITDSELKEGIILKRQLTLPNDIKTIPQLSEFIEGIGEELDMDMSLIMSLNLALEEAVTQGDVCIKTTANETQIEFIIIDSGIPFDPTKKEEVDITMSAEERPIGGLGIHLVREIMDTVNYEYKDNKNILTLSKKIK